MNKKLITEETIDSIYQNGNMVVAIGQNDIVTPSAYDKIRQLKMQITDRTETDSKIETDEWKPTDVAIGCDHTGFTAKQKLIEFLKKENINIKDVGTLSEKSCDYPDYAVAVVREVLEGNVCFGIILDATGVPSAITANKFPSIRAATCYNEFSAESARAHNNSNVLVMGAKTLGDETIKSILKKFIATKFDGGRHQKRLDKITSIEEKLLNKNLR